MAPRRRAAPEPWTAEQRRLAELRVARDEIDWAVHGHFVCGLERVAGVDVSFFPDSTYAVAAVVVLSFSSFKVVYVRCAAIRLAVPYIPGYLAFREVPALATLLEEVPPALAPQVVLVDGNGAFHPRRCGAATHLGILTNLPTVGVAKSVQRVDDVNRRKAETVAKSLRGASEWAPLGEKASAKEAEEAEDEDEPLAMLLRPCDGKGTVVVSSGHRVSLETAVRLTAVLCREGRVPEPIRQADLHSRAAVREWFEGKNLGDLAIKDGLLPALPSLKRPPPEEEEDGEAAKASRKSRGKPALVWRVKASSEPECAPEAKAESRPEAAPKCPGAAPEGKAARRAEKRSKVWRVKAATAGVQDASTAAAEIVAAEAQPEDKNLGIVTSVLFWLGNCCLCRG
uniref:Endonuclease V n=1 Tax=Alexandrium monilatum TaxID=311494 RepID=A0A7S4T9G5_9DINO|mmetsp:Transcript_15721/g.47137  ORF Transcript_15721/g.47137 Transcript_15721/m.47137 type:complete len:398 (+) Transcript_15721:49-1242(+)